MAEFTVEAIVLRRWPAGENDRRLALLTKERGKIYALAKGARKSKSRFNGISEPLTHATIQLTEGRVRLFVTMAQAHSSYPGLRRDYDRLAAGLALAEVAAAGLPEDAPAEESFESLQIALAAIADSERWTPGFLWGSCRLLQEHGIWPDWLRCVATGDEIRHTPVSVSASAGGALVEAEAMHYRDAFRVPWESLVALQRLVELPGPPGNVKQAGECARVLHVFWRHTLDARLSAGDEALRAASTANE